MKTRIKYFSPSLYFDGVAQKRTEAVKNDLRLDN